MRLVEAPTNPEWKYICMKIFALFNCAYFGEDAPRVNGIFRGEWIDFECIIWLEEEINGLQTMLKLMWYDFILFVHYAMFRHLRYFLLKSAQPEEHLAISSGVNLNVRFWCFESVYLVRKWMCPFRRLHIIFRYG